MNQAVNDTCSLIICATAEQCAEFGIPINEGSKYPCDGGCGSDIYGPPREAAEGAPLLCEVCANIKIDELAKGDTTVEITGGLTGAYAAVKAQRAIRRLAEGLMREEAIEQAVDAAFKAADTEAACATVLTDIGDGPDEGYAWSAFNAGNCALAACVLSSFKAEHEGGLLKDFTNDQMITIGQVLTKASEEVSAYAERGGKPVEVVA